MIKKLRAALAFAVVRLVNWAAFDVKYKKVYLQIKKCPDVEIVHNAHPWATTQHGYSKTDPVPYYCEGVQA